MILSGRAVKLVCTQMQTSGDATVSLYEMQAVISRALRLESDDRDDPIIELRET